jgi:ribosomal protein S18 acetylase RimI-like enzyme
MKYRFFSLSELLESASKNKTRKLLKTFKCKKNTDLESFLHHKAILFEEKGRIRTYLLIDFENKKIVAYFSIGISVLNISELENDVKVLLSGDENNKRDFIPCYLIGQLGKSDEYKKCKIGKNLLSKAVKTIKECQIKLNGRFILLDAVNNTKVLRFYTKHNFMPIEKITKNKESIKMILPIVKE